MWFALASLGCTGNTGPGFMGIEVFDHFPLDGQRWWDYAQDDLTIETRLHVEKEPNVVTNGGMDVITLSYSEVDGALLYEVQWSSDSENGVLVHGFTTNGGGTVKFDPPVKFGDAYMEEGESVETTSGGATFTSNYVQTESCTNHWVQDDPWECLHFEITADSGDFPFTGAYWIAPRYAVSSFTPAGYTTPWVLTEANWKADGDTGQ